MDNYIKAIDVDLKNGHINGVASFLLMVPTARKNPEEEIILTELLRTLGYLSPRTSLVNVKLNNCGFGNVISGKGGKRVVRVSS